MTARVLVVEDTKIWRNNIKRALQKKYHVDTADSLKQALDLLRNSEPYQVVITDIGLSKDETNTDGIELLKEVHRHWPTTMTIAVSGRAVTVNQEKFKKEYDALVYLERDILSEDRNTFIDWVDTGVALSREAEKEDRDYHE